MGYSLDFVGRVWDDKTGDRIEFGEDNDSLGLVSIRYVNNDGTVHSEITMPEEQARLFLSGLTEWLDRKVKE